MTGAELAALIISNMDTVPDKSNRLAIMTAMGDAIIAAIMTTPSGGVSGTAVFVLSMAPGDTVANPVTVTGAVLGNTVRLGFNPPLPDSAFATGVVSAADTVHVSVLNLTGSPLSLTTTCEAFVDA